MTAWDAFAQIVAAGFVSVIASGCIWWGVYMILTNSGHGPNAADRSGLVAGGAVGAMSFAAILITVFAV